MSGKSKCLSCSWLEHGIIFDHENLIRVCCSQCNEGGGRPVLTENYFGKKLEWKKIFKAKRQMRQIQRKGKVYDACKGCISLREDEWDNDDYIDHLLLTHWIKCNCRCIYCSAVTDEQLKKINKHYNIIPVLKDMCKRQLLKTDAFISIAGGEATIYPEFEDMLSLLLDYGCNNILLNTSGIKYSPKVAEGIAGNKIKVTVSIDAGTEEMHKYIKNADVYNKVYETLSVYAKAQDDNKDMINSKYIIIPGVNDREHEMEQWIEDTRYIGIKHISIDIDFNWIRENREELRNKRKIYELLLFAKKLAEKEGLILDYYEGASILRNIHKVPTAIFGGTLKRIKG